MNDSNIPALLDAVPASDCTYQEWVNVGMALHAEGLPCTIWEQWSAKDSARYHHGECERKWRTFGNGSEIVTIGTLYHMARERGFSINSENRTYGWDDYITTDGDEIDHSGWHHEHTNMDLPQIADDYNAIKDITDYLTALFDTDDKVSFVNSAYQDADGRWKPTGGVNGRTCGELLSSLKKHKDITDTFGTPTEGAGTWICFNPMDGGGRSNSNVTNYKYALVESDSQSIENQYALMQDLKLPVRVLVHSGGKSLHAIVSIDACDYKQYKERVDYLYTVCRKNGLIVDTQDKNPARLSRFPGFMRGDKRQYIVARDMGLPDFVEWKHYIEDEAVEPFEKRGMKDVREHREPLKPELIKGILRCGHKMMLVSSSKAGKTFCLIELAMSIAEGRKWLGYECRMGRVLYLNMELDSASFEDRVIRVYEASGVQNPHDDNIDIVHLRGKIEDMDKLVARIIRTMKGQSYSAVIIDPIYKMGIGDENAAEQVSRFCNAIDRIANEGASVIYAHHHSKGVQGQKSSMDRASGSGVFARDADALIDMIELHIDESIAPAVEAKYDARATAWQLETTLREFARQEPKQLFFCYPLHEEDDEGLLQKAKLQEEARALDYGREKGAVSVQVKKQTGIEALENILSGDELFGRYRTVQEYAEDLGVTSKTVRKYLDELGYGVKNSIVFKA